MNPDLYKTTLEHLVRRVTRAVWTTEDRKILNTPAGIGSHGGLEATWEGEETKIYSILFTTEEGEPLFFYHPPALTVCRGVSFCPGELTISSD